MLKTEMKLFVEELQETLPSGVNVSKLPADWFHETPVDCLWDVMHVLNAAAFETATTFQSSSLTSKSMLVSLIHALRRIVHFTYLFHLKVRIHRCLNV